LKLSDGERIVNSKAWKGVSPGATHPVSLHETPKLAVRQLDSLAGGFGKEMSAKDIGREYMSSVVVVQSDGESGSGVVLGRDGYKVTCKLCIPPQGELRVVYRTHVPGRPATKTAVATIVKTDRAHDLALIKIAATKLPPVRIGSSSDLEAGARVTAIG